MRHSILSFSLVATCALSCALLTGCGDSDKGPMEKSGEAVDKAAGKTGEVIKEGAQKTGEAVKTGAEKTGDAVKDATN